MATMATVTPARRRGNVWRGQRFRDTLTAYLFVAPAAVLLLIFSLVAISVSLVISFSDWSPVKEHWQIVGIDNYRKAFSDARFWQAFRNTGQFVLFTVPGIAITSLLLAVIGNHARKLRSVFRTLFFIPVITPGVVVALVWIWMYKYDGGVNAVLAIVGIKGPNWLFDPVMAMPAIILMTIWSAVGYYMIIFMAGLADIPEIYYEAAKVDGANRWQTFWNITFPLLRNPLIFVAVTLMIAAWQVFTQMYVMTQGGPAGKTESVQWRIWANAFQDFDMGVAAAMSWALFAVVFVFTAIQLKIFVSRQTY